MNKVFVNSRAITHAAGQAMSIKFPDVCKTPGPPAPFIPVPYPNISQGSDTDDGSTKTTAHGKPIALKDSSVFKISTGNEAGTAGGGMLSSVTKGKSSYDMYSMNVKIEGKEVPRAFDIMCGNF
jgi:hypothetical protein